MHAIVYCTSYYIRSIIWQITNEMYDLNNFPLLKDFNFMPIDHILIVLFILLAEKCNQSMVKIEKTVAILFIN